MIFVGLGMVLIHHLEKLSTLDRFLVGGMVVVGLTPIGKISKVGKGVKMTADATKVVNKTKKYLLRK